MNYRSLEIKNLGHSYRLPFPPSISFPSPCSRANVVQLACSNLYTNFFPNSKFVHEFFHSLKIRTRISEISCMNFFFCCDFVQEFLPKFVQKFIYEFIYEFYARNLHGIRNFWQTSEKFVRICMNLRRLCYHWPVL